MKNIIRNFVISSVALSLLVVSACTDAAEPVNISKISPPTRPPARPATDSHGHTEGQDAPRISLADAKKAFDDGSAVFMDTHVKAAYDNEHIKGAINVTVQELDAKFSTIPKGKKIIAYCS